MAGHVHVYKPITGEVERGSPSNEPGELQGSPSSEPGELQVLWETLPQTLKPEVGDNRKGCLL